MLMIANLPRYKCAKNYQNRAWFNKVIAKIKGCSFFYSHGKYNESVSSVAAISTSSLDQSVNEIHACEVISISKKFGEGQDSAQFCLLFTM